MTLKPEELGKVIERNLKIFTQELLGEEKDGERTDFCYVCGKPFQESQAEFCEECRTFKCPHCQGCFCSLPLEAQRALDFEMASLGLWDISVNPRKRKRRTTPFEMTRSEFLSYAERVHPDLYARYIRGEFDFNRLHGEIMAKIDRTIHIRG
jgi:hypothetical protein